MRYCLSVDNQFDFILLPLLMRELPFCRTKWQPVIGTDLNSVKYFFLDYLSVNSFNTIELALSTDEVSNDVR